MGRRKSFDEKLVLARALDFFTTYGYETASVRQIAIHMGIGESSFYNAFGDKRSLYLRTVQHYVSEEVRIIDSYLGEHRLTAESLTALFESAITRIRHGSFNSSLTLHHAHHDSAVRTLIAAGQQQLQQSFEAALVRGQFEGTVTRTHNPRVLSFIIINGLHSLHLTAHTSPDSTLLEDIADAVINVIRP